MTARTPTRVARLLVAAVFFCSGLHGAGLGFADDAGVQIAITLPGHGTATLSADGRALLSRACFDPKSQKTCEARSALSRVTMDWVVPGLVSGGRHPGTTLCAQSGGRVVVGRLEHGELAVCVFKDESITTLESLAKLARANDLARKKN